MWYSFLQIHAKCKVMLFYNWPRRNHQFRDFILFLNFICGFLWFQTLLRVFWCIFLLLLIFREFSYCSFFYSLKLKEIKIMKWSRKNSFWPFSSPSCWTIFLSCSSLTSHASPAIPSFWRRISGSGIRASTPEEVGYF